MSHFSPHDAQILFQPTDEAQVSDLRQRFQSLYDYLLSQARLHNLSLHNLEAVQLLSSPDHRNGTRMLVGRWSRPVGAALTVERLMGREMVNSASHILSSHHPLIELRLQSDYLVLELAIQPEAWFDQQNIMGKLSLARNQTQFYQLLAHLDERYCLGFWHGHHLSEMHLTMRHLRRIELLNEWLSTFEPSKDTFRLGLWLSYEQLGMENLSEKLSEHLTALYKIYDFLLWTSDNNHREAYLQSQVQLSLDINEEE